MKFSELGLDPVFSSRLETAGIVEATSIQAEIFGPILEGKSLCGLSKTGTGKTLAYLSPLMQKYMSDTAASPESFKILVIVPTRELADQVRQNLSMLWDEPKGIAVVVGGEPEDKQVEACRNALFIVATPGRFLDLLERRMIVTERVATVVFDEADRLLDMGFVDDMRAIIKKLPKNMQMIFVSATLHFGVEEVAYELGAHIERFGQEAEEATVEGLDHKIAFVGDDEKFNALVHFIHARGDSRGIVFSNYREKAHEIARRLRGLGCKAEALSAQLTQAARIKITEDYRSGDIKVMVASDLASRGLDFADIDFVVNYDLSEDPAIYVHRVGRTARAGRVGVAVSYIGYEDSYRLEKTEKFLGKKIERFDVPHEHLKGPLPRWGAPEQARFEEPREMERGGRGGDRGGRGGPRGDRGDRPQGPRNEGPRRDGPRNEGPRRDGQRNAGPRNQGPRQGQPERRPQTPQGPRPEPKSGPVQPKQVASAPRKNSIWTTILGIFGIKPAPIKPRQPQGGGKSRPSGQQPQGNGPRREGERDGERSRRRRRGGRGRGPSAGRSTPT